MRDYLVWYNNRDVSPFLEALENQIVFYQKMNIGRPYVQGRNVRSGTGIAVSLFQGLSTSVGVPGTGAGASTRLAGDAPISGRFLFPLAPHTVHRCFYHSVDTFFRREIVFFSSNFIIRHHPQW